MKAQIPRRYFLIPVLYVLLVAGLLTAEFSGTTKVEDRLQNISITATLPARATGIGAPQRLTIDINGFIFSFDEKKPLELRLASGRSLYASLSGYSTGQGSAAVNFGELITMKFFGSGNQNRIEIAADLNEAALLIVPFSYSNKVEVDVLSGLPLLTVSRRNGQSASPTAVALPARSAIDTDNGTLILRNDEDGFESIYIDRLEGNDPIAFWFQTHHEDLPGRYDETRKSYIDASFLGWTETRYSTPAGAWRMPDTTSQFDERILVAALTEATKRGVFRNTYNGFRNSLRLHADKLTFFSAPHLGNIVETGDEITAADLATIRRVEDLVITENTSVFTIPALLAFARDRAPTPLFQDIVDFAARIDPASVYPHDVPGMLDVYLESRSFDGPFGEAFDGFRLAVDLSLLPAIHLTDYGYFLISADGRVDVKASLQAGRALETLGSVEDAGLYREIGRELATSALLLADSEGFLPAKLTEENNTITGTAGTLRPEEIYPLIAGERYYPKYVSLTSELGEGAWAWTCAESFTAEQNDSRTTISFEYPVGGTHHFIVRGVEPFSFMTFFGIRWVSDPQFQMYGSGWLYDPAEQTLYVKITHTKEREELVISYE